MPGRTLPLAAALALVASVAGANADDLSAQKSTETLSPVEQAWVNVADSYVEHYNEGRADAVAPLYTEDAWSIPADGLLLLQGREEIRTELERAFEFAPTLDVTGVDNLILGDVGVAIGTYHVSLTLENDSLVRYGGSWLNLMRRVEGEWRIAGSILNYDALRPEGWNWRYPADTDSATDEGTMGDAVEHYVTTWNMGRPDEVADTYAEDAAVSLPNGAWLHGRTAVASSLGETMPEGSVITVHDVATLPLDEGWALDGGWYLVAGDDGATLWVGAYVHLMSQQADGSWKIQWALANAVPPRGESDG